MRRLVYDTIRFVFFKQKTAYEMRISDWSSGVCSSDLSRVGVGDLFSLRVGQDDKHPDRYIVTMYQSGLGMPDRDYYLKADPKLDQTRTAYKAYLAKMLTLAGESNAEARRSEEHTSELQSLTLISYAVFCFIKKIQRFITLPRPSPVLIT